MRDSCPVPERARIEAGVRAKYEDVAGRPSGHFPYPVGRESAARLRYLPEWLVGIPDEVVERFVGVGNPFEVYLPQPGERVIDLGCGAGLDAYVAARAVGPTGRVTGLDLTPAMLATARGALAAVPLGVLDFREGSLLDLPFEAGSFDVALSNGVLNLVADKDVAFREIARVLRPGGTLAAADLVVVETVPQEVLDDPAAWAT